MKKIVLLACLTALPLALTPPAWAVKPVRSTASFTSPPTVLDLCSFPVTLVSDNLIRETDFFDRHGDLTKVLLHVDERDTFTALGKSLTGSRYTFEIRVTFDDQGNVTHIFSTGLNEKLTFPDGALFISAGRVDFAAHPGSVFLISPDVGVSGDLDAFCDFFADP